MFCLSGHSALPEGPPMRNTNAWSSGEEGVQVHLGHPPVAGWTGAEAGGMDPCGPTTVLPEKVN